MSRSAWKPLAVLAVLVSLGTAACSSSSESAGDATTTTSAPSTCEAVQSLADSIGALVSTDTLSGGKSSIDAAIATVQSALTEVGDVAGQQLSSDVDAISQALDGLSSSVGDLSSGESLGDTLSAIGTSLNDVVDAFDTLVSDASTELSNCQITTPSTVGG